MVRLGSFKSAVILAFAASVALFCGVVSAHDVAASDANFVRHLEGVAFVPFIYLGAKHMVTGIDHVLFLIGVVFFLFRLRDVILYVSMFAIGHTVTLLGGVLLSVDVNAHLVDAIIGLSVVYKGVENLGGFHRLGIAIDSRVAVLSFGLAHGLGLATKLLDLNPSKSGLLANLVGFNVGVELGQILVLAIVVVLLNQWRHTRSFRRGAVIANVGLVAAGIALTIYQLRGYIVS